VGDLYTEADVELAARALFDAECRVTDATWEWNLITEDDRESYRRVQRAALNALTAAGWRKLPDAIEPIAVEIEGWGKVGAGQAKTSERYAYFHAAKILRKMAASPSTGEDRSSE